MSETRFIPSGYSPTTGVLADRLKSGKPGDVVTDEELTSVCLKDTRVDGDGYNNLLSAMRYCEKTQGVVWQRVRGENRLECQNDEGKYHAGRSRLSSARRFARTASRVLLLTDIDSLPEDDRPKARAAAAVAGMMSAVSRPSAVKQLADMGASEVPAQKALLDIFRKG
jgi:hypothetical protein